MIDAGPNTLLERGAELAGLSAQLGAARAASGSVAVLEAPAGQGKTALLRVLRGEGGEQGFRVLTATGGPLERDFAFGIVRQLFDAELHGADETRRERLFAGAARLAEPVFASAHTQEAQDPAHSTLYGLYWLAANLASEQPLLIVVDDAHWADAPSLRFLDALARRVEDLPVLLAIGARPAEPGAEQALIDGLATAPATRVLRPQALSASAVKAFVHERLDAEPAFVEACFETTRGNPLLLAELLRATAFEGRADEADRVRTTVPRTIAARLRSLSPAALAVARATAVLGDATSLRRVAALARLDEAQAALQLRALANANVIDAADARFVHPMIRETVEADLGAERSRLHHEAARLLHEDGALDGVVATHLLATEPTTDPWAAEILANAGRRALAEGAPDVALRLLGRAEPKDASVQLALGLAQFRAGEDPLPALDAAAADPDLAVEATKLAATALILRSEPRAAAARLRATLALTPPVRRGELEDQLVEALAYRDDDAQEYHETVEAHAHTNRPTVLCHLAHLRAMAGAPRSEVLPAWRRAFANSTVFARLGVERFAALWAIEALHAVEAADEAKEATRALSDLTDRAGSRSSSGASAWMEARWERRFGHLRRAEDLARHGLELAQGATIPELAIGTTLAGVLLDRGDLAGARQALASLPDLGPTASIFGLAAVHARVLLEDGEPEAALEALARQEAADTARRWLIGLREDSHALRIRALKALGREEEAVAFAQAEIAKARAREAAGAEAVLHLAIGDPQRAVEAANRSPLPLVKAIAAAELGFALRREGRRAEARTPLREARDLAHRVGATALEERVHEELVVAGARPQRLAFSGVDALTASERRVAELAVRGLRNREIAETLFVSLKTVEVHLGRAYTKLGIKGRSQLKAALAT
ncbi:AAA family ATPase [Solirubrobacter sp. CPCC 204708]|uniref:AAA family ATPase n=1 Tax=Solirubrobacter deserti TaxID=2282478 RepID=A0ABT4RHS0_9ACTN|nr:LuxR family transcriptional regulator [Solirubrobacter deserti]MBE2316548.1 AAA family ATPase [Solirubrobacter deserti]MDA0138082.1 AAA family ATPase [Solirubrobacter deserti]